VKAEAFAEDVRRWLCFSAARRSLVRIRPPRPPKRRPVRIVRFGGPSSFFGVRCGGALSSVATEILVQPSFCGSNPVRAQAARRRYAHNSMNPSGSARSPSTGAPSTPHAPPRSRRGRPPGRAGSARCPPRAPGRGPSRRRGERVDEGRNNADDRAGHLLRAVELVGEPRAPAASDPRGLWRARCQDEIGTGPDAREAVSQQLAVTDRGALVGACPGLQDPARGPGDHRGDPVILDEGRHSALPGPRVGRAAAA
jgi:hypothetical protein